MLADSGPLCCADSDSFISYIKTDNFVYDQLFWSNSTSESIKHQKLTWFDIFSCSCRTRAAVSMGSSERSGNQSIFRYILSHDIIIHDCCHFNIRKDEETSGTVYKLWQNLATTIGKQRKSPNTKKLKNNGK